jgi:hypothetical protein
MKTDISKLLPRVCEKCGRKLRGKERCKEHDFKAQPSMTR